MVREFLGLFVGEGDDMGPRLFEECCLNEGLDDTDVASAFRGSSVFFLRADVLAAVFAGSPFSAWPPAVDSGSALLVAIVKVAHYNEIRGIIDSSHAPLLC